jgi:hypothetical protein
MVSVDGDDFPQEYLDLLTIKKHRHFWIGSGGEKKRFFLEWKKYP